MSRTTSRGAASPTILSGPDAIHADVCECLDAMREVLLAAYPCRSNLLGTVNPTEANRRLDRLQQALAVLPARHLEAPDCFTLPDDPDPAEIEVREYLTVQGSSLHDAAIRLVFAIHDRLRVRRIDTDKKSGKAIRDPGTGEIRAGVDYPFAVELPASGGGRRVAMGPPVVPHYTEQRWSEEAWELLIPVVRGQALALLPKGVFDRLPLLLRNEYSSAVARCPAVAVPSASRGAPSSNRPKKRNGTPPKGFEKVFKAHRAFRSQLPKGRKPILEIFFKWLGKNEPQVYGLVETKEAKARYEKWYRNEGCRHVN